LVLRRWKRLVVAEEVPALNLMEQDPPPIIRLVRIPEDAAHTLRPNPRMNLAVAGVLSLSVGVLPAFFTEGDDQRAS